jgi:hypothetical protein
VLYLWYKQKETRKEKMTTPETPVTKAQIEEIKKLIMAARNRIGDSIKSLESCIVDYVLAGIDTTNFIVWLKAEKLLLTLLARYEKERLSETETKKD